MTSIEFIEHHYYPHRTHFSNFIGFLSNGGYSLSWLPLPTKSYTPVLRHICLNAFIPTFLFAPCDHHPPPEDDDRITSPPEDDDRKLAEDLSKLAEDLR